LRDRTLPRQKAGRGKHHRHRVKLAELVQAPQPVRQQDRKCHLIELRALEIRPAIDPEILRKAAVGELVDPQVYQRAKCGLRVACGEQSSGALDQVAYPDEMISAESVHVASGFAPGDGKRSNDRALIGFIFMREQ
jgi:hypothetical protein